VVLAAYSGGGSGDFITLHILDIASARAFDLAGKVYEHINLTELRRIALGDRWEGEISIAKNTIRVVTTRKGPADDTGARDRGEEAVSRSLGVHSRRATSLRPAAITTARRRGAAVVHLANETPPGPLHWAGREGLRQNVRISDADLLREQEAYRDRDPLVGAVALPVGGQPSNSLRSRLVSGIPLNSFEGGQVRYGGIR